MSIENYNQLAALAEDQTFFGVKLPTLTPANINIDSIHCSISEVLALIAQFSPSQGWVTYRDCVTISHQPPTRNDIIEAEYTDGTDTLIVRLIESGRYMVTTITSSDSEGETNTCYLVQPIFVRNTLKASANKAVYRIWYQQTDHKWNPLLQQFVGFESQNNQGGIAQ